MSLDALYPTTDYAEDQRLFHTILLTHVVQRGIPIGTVVSSVIPLTSRYILRRASTLPLSTQLLRSTSTGFLVTSAVMVGMTYGRMWGREEIEWKDRSWRLLRNKGQTELDDFSVAGGMLGAIAGGLGHGALPLWRGVLGGAGYGMLAGTVVYAVWKMSASKGDSSSEHKE
ncbi:hypothetical protein ABW19_dt0207778 [Dactylella cylindrospora]|nr:hypothetical protein ABW19_dt0207778 [Dactylella cylindrospora]